MREAFALEKIKEALVMQKLLTFFSTKNIGAFQITASLVLNNRAQMFFFLTWQPCQSSQKSMKIYGIKSGKMIKMHLTVLKFFTRPNEFLPDMSGGQTKFREDCHAGQMQRLV